MDSWAGAREALFAAGIAGDSLAGRLLKLVIEAGASLTMARYELTARLAASESGLRYALLKLRSAGLVRDRAVRGVVELVAELPAPRQAVLEFEAGVERQVVSPERGDLEVRSAAPAGQPAEKELGEVQAGPVNAQRESAARSRRAATEQAGGARREAGGKTRKGFTEAELAAMFPALCREEETPPARDVHSYSPIPHSPPLSTSVEIPSPPRKHGARSTEHGGNVARQSRGGMLAAWKRKITALVRLDGNFPWVAWSAALLAIDGPLSEAVLAGCIEGSHGDGRKFVAALKHRLAECDVGELSKRSLVDARGRPQLHRFPYLRPALAAHGIQLSDDDTRLVRTRRRA